MSATFTPPSLTAAELDTATYFPELGPALTELQTERLRQQLGYCYETSEFYRTRLDAVGVHPRDIYSLETFRDLPLRIVKTDERESEEQSLERFGHPFGMHLCADPSEVVGIAASTGTTGRPTFSYLFTAADLQKVGLLWARAMAWMNVPPGSLILHGLGLSMWVVGCPAVRALVDIGMRPIPVGAEGGAPRMLQMADLLSPEVMICTPSMAEQMLERSVEVLGKPVSALSIRKILCCGEPGGGLPEVRKRLGDAFGARIYDGSAGAHMARVSCHTEEYYGMHMLTEDLVLTEMVDLETFAPIEQTDGALGRVLQTSLVHQARPLIKFDTGDVYQVFTSQCPGCGHTLRRIKVLGRADDMLLIGGVNVYPSAIKDLVVQFAPRTTGEVRIVLSEPPPRVHPPLKLRVEAAEGATGGEADGLRADLEARIRDVLRFRASVELLDPFALDRSGGKTQLIVKEY